MITEVMPFAFNDTSVRSLSFSGNPLRKLHSYSFTDVRISYTLSMSSLQIKTIPTHAFFDVSAYDFLLSSGLIEHIEEQAFYDVTVSDDM